MKITNVEVHGLEDAILASGFAFRSDFDPDKISDQKALLRAYLCRKKREASSFRVLTDEEFEWCE